MADFTQLPDAELWKLAVETHSEEAFHALMARHRDPVWALCSRMLRHGCDAEDAFQMAFLAVLEHGAKIRSIDFGAWLYRVAYRAALRVQANRIQGADTTDLNAIEESSMDADVFREIEQSEQSQIIEAAMDSLPDKYREVLVLHYCSGITRDEIAERLGLTPQAVKARLSRGRTALRSRLMRRGLSLSLAAMLLSSQSQAAMVPSQVEANTWQLAQQWRAGQPVRLDIAEFTDSLMTENGMKSLNGLNAKFSFAAVASIAALFFLIEAVTASGSSGASDQRGLTSSDLHRLDSVETQSEMVDSEPPVRIEVFQAPHVAAKPSQNLPHVPVQQQPDQPMVQMSGPQGRIEAISMSQDIDATQTAALNRMGPQDGKWIRQSTLGAVSFIVDGRQLRVEFEAADESSMPSGSASGEFSIAADGTVYGLIHSVVMDSISADDDRMIASLGDLLTDMPFSMRVHTRDDAMALKSLNFKLPAATPNTADLITELDDFSEFLSLFMAGTYQMSDPQPTQKQPSLSRQTQNRVESISMSQDIDATQMAALNRMGPQDGKWIRQTTLGAVSFIVDGRQLRVEFETADESSLPSGSASGEFSIAADGTVYGLIHSVVMDSISADDDGMIVSSGGLLTDMPFSTRVHTRDDAMALKSLNFKTPAVTSNTADLIAELDDLPKFLSLFMAGTYQMSDPQPTQKR